jgi:hypothetical protein
VTDDAPRDTRPVRTLEDALGGPPSAALRELFRLWPQMTLREQGWFRTAGHRVANAAIPVETVTTWPPPK